MTERSPGSAWAEIVAWCRAHAPVTAEALAGPADPAALAMAQDATGLRWPSELVGWLSSNDGAGRRAEASLLPPAFVPLGVDDIVRTWSNMTASAFGVSSAAELEEAESAPAGTWCNSFLRPWVPFAVDGSGNFYFVDLRDGERHGCVGEWYHDDGFVRDPWWHDIAAMLVDVADALRKGRWAKGDLVPLVEGGAFAWDDAPGWETLRAPASPTSDEELQARLAEAADARRRAKEAADWARLRSTPPVDRGPSTIRLTGGDRPEPQEPPAADGGRRRG